MRSSLAVVAVLVAAVTLPGARAAESPVLPDKVKSLAQKLNGTDKTLSSKARDELRRLPMKDIILSTRALVERLRERSPHADDAYAVLGLLGPDCGEAAGPLAEELRGEKKDPERRKALIALLGQLGTASRDAIPMLRDIAGQDADPRLREAAKEALENINVADARVQEVLTALKLRAYKDDDERDAVHGALTWSLEHCMASSEVTVALARLELDSKVNEDLVAGAGQIEMLLRNNEPALRIAMPVFEKAIEGPDEKLRATALGLLVNYSCGQPYPWTPTLGLEKMLDSTNPAVRAKAAEALGQVCEKLKPAGIERRAIRTVLPKLQELANKDQDESVRKAAAEALKAFAGVTSGAGQSR